jgi:hypothetical protein
MNSAWHGYSHLNSYLSWLTLSNPSWVSWIVSQQTINIVKDKYMYINTYKAITVICSTVRQWLHGCTWHFDITLKYTRNIPTWWSHFFPQYPLFFLQTAAIQLNLLLPRTMFLTLYFSIDCALQPENCLPLFLQHLGVKYSYTKTELLGNSAWCKVSTDLL